jgi:hypothetical protein
MTDRSPTPAPAPLAAGLLGLLVMLQVASASWLWSVIAHSWAVDRTSYRAVWLASGFRDLPIDELAAALDARLPPETPIKLGPRFEGSGPWAQRLKEGLYPRLVTRDASAVLEFAGPAELDPLLRTPRASFVLTGSLPAPPAAVRPSFDFGMSWWRIYGHALGAFGWGAAIALALRRRREIPLLAGAALAAPVCLGVLGTVATVVQRPLPWTALTVVGALLGAAAIALELRRRLRGGDLRACLGLLRQPELWGLGLLSAIMVRHALLAPIVGWDGRSIWLYRAKQVAHHGYLAAADALNPLNFFSHMEYPLLVPTWLAHFAAASPFREREAAVAAILLELALFGYLWWISSRTLGRWVGAAFLGTVWLVTMAASERLFADGFLGLLLLAALFSLEDEDTAPFGWLALLGAALTKAEGLFFAAAVAGLFLLLHPRFRARPWPRRLAPAAVLLVGAIPPLWARAIGVHGQYAEARLPATVGVTAGRLGAIGSGVFQLARESVPLASLGAALVLYLVLEATGRRSPLSRVMAGAGLAIIAFSVAVMMVTPYELSEQVNVAMERLLSHAVLALLAAVLVALVGGSLTARRAAP